MEHFDFSMKKQMPTDEAKAGKKAMWRYIGIFAAFKVALIVGVLILVLSYI